MKLDDMFLVDVDGIVNKEKERFKKILKEAKRRKELIDSGVKECELEEYIRREEEEELNKKKRRLERKEAKKRAEEEKKHKKKKKRKLQLSKGLKEQIKERDGYKCTKCGSDEDLHVHHIIHRENGGTNDEDNLITLCEECHIKEHEGEHVERLMRKNRKLRMNNKN